jgi:hypothetical protein
VCAAVGSVVKLVGPDSVLETLSMTLSLVVVVLGVLEGDGRDRVDLSTEETEQVDLSLGLGVGHVDNTLVTLGTTDVSESDSGVSGGSFDDGSSGLDKAALLGVLDHVEGGAVCGVVVLVGDPEMFNGGDTKHTPLTLPPGFMNSAFP